MSDKSFNENEWVHVLFVLRKIYTRRTNIKKIGVMIIIINNNIFWSKKERLCYTPVKLYCRENLGGVQQCCSSFFIRVRKTILNVFNNI